MIEFRFESFRAAILTVAGRTMLRVQRGRGTLTLARGCRRLRPAAGRAHKQ